MSLKSKYNAILKGKLAAGLEYDVLPTGDVSLNFVLLRKKKSVVEVVESGSHIASLDLIKSKIPSGVPVFLVLNGKGVINRCVEYPEGDLLNHILPNASGNDFFLSQFEGHNGKRFASVVRKKFIEGMYGLFRNQGMEVINIAVGPIGITQILPLLSSDGNSQIIVGRHKFYLMDGMLSAHEQAESNGDETNYNIGEEKLQGSVLIAFAAALTYFSTDTSSGNVELVAEARNEFLEKRKFLLFGMSYIIGLLILLLANFVLFTYYSSRFDQLNSEFSKNGVLLSRCDTLQNYVEEKRKFLEERGLLYGSRTSWYSDQLASTLPDDIRLDRLNIYPLLPKREMREEELRFENRSIIVEGQCRKSSGLNKWITELQLHKWVKSVTLVNFAQDKPASAGVFSIRIEIV